MFSLALTSHQFSCYKAASEWGLAETCSYVCRASLWPSWRLRPVNAACLGWGTLNKRGTFPMPVRDILPQSKSITAPAFSRKLMPSRLVRWLEESILGTRRWIRVLSAWRWQNVVDLCPGLLQSHHMVLSWWRLRQVMSRNAGLQNRDVEACIYNQTSWFSFYFDRKSASSLLQRDRNRWIRGSVVFLELGRMEADTRVRGSDSNKVRF